MLGRPNTGKSTLLNRLLGEERLLTGPEPGLTRDSIGLDAHWRDRKLKVFDTAGLRRKSRVVEKLEKLAVADALRAVRFAEVVILLLDATIPFEKQDLTLADFAEREGRAVVIGLNKWDLIPDKSLSNLFRRAVANFEYRGRDLGSVLIEKRPQDFQGAPVLVACMDPHAGTNGFSSDRQAIRNRDALIAQAGGSINVSRQIGEIRAHVRAVLPQIRIFVQSIAKGWIGVIQSIAQAV